MSKLPISYYRVLLAFRADDLDGAYAPDTMYQAGKDLTDPMILFDLRHHVGQGEVVEEVTRVVEKGERLTYFRNVVIYTNETPESAAIEITHFLTHLNVDETLAFVLTVSIETNHHGVYIESSRAKFGYREIT